MGSEELCATTARANAVGRLYVCWAKERRTGREGKLGNTVGKENLPNSHWENLTGFNARFKKKKFVSKEGISRSSTVISRSFLPCFFC